MTGSGFMMGTILDLYRVLQVRLRLRGWVVSLVDFVYWLVCAGLVFSLLFWSNWGDFRFYIFIAIVAGLATYLHWFSSKVRQSLIWILDIIEKTAYQCYRILYNIIWVPILHIVNVLKKIWGFTVTIIQGTLEILLRPFRWLFRPVQRVVIAQFQKHFAWTSRLKKWWKRKNEDEDEDEEEN